MSERVYVSQANDAALALVAPSLTPVLDVGCGAGDNARILTARGITVDGITHAPAEAKLAARYCREVFVHDLERGLPVSLADASYRCVLCSHVLEHLRDPGPVLRDAARVLMPGGLLVVALPNLLVFGNRLRILSGRFEYATHGLMDETHVRFYTFASAQALLEQHGFRRRTALADGSLPLTRRWFGQATWIDRLACRWFPGLFGYQLLFAYERDSCHA